MIRAYHMALPRFFAAVVACALLAGTPVLADEIQEINQQYRKGDLTGALDRANRFLAVHPQDAQPRENPGGIYVKMAGIAYDKAQALDSTNTTAQTKLTLIRNLLGEQPGK